MSILAEEVKECIKNNMSVTLTPDEARQFHAEFEQSYIEYKQRAEAAEAKLRELESILHYPGCWDTACYSTLQDAVREVFHCSVCANPEAHGVDAKPFPAPKQDEK